MSQIYLFSCTFENENASAEVTVLLTASSTAPAASVCLSGSPPARRYLK